MCQLFQPFFRPLKLLCLMAENFNSESEGEIKRLRESMMAFDSKPNFLIQALATIGIMSFLLVIDIFLWFFFFIFTKKFSIINSVLKLDGNYNNKKKFNVSAFKKIQLKLSLNSFSKDEGNSKKIVNISFTLTIKIFNRN